MLFKKKKRKISEMLLDISDYYIKRSYEEEDFRQTIFDATTAWNLSLLDNTKREEAIKKYRKSTKKDNPHFTKQDLNNDVKMIRNIIKNKIDKYPNENRPIMDVSVERLPDGKFKVDALSVDTK